MPPKERPIPTPIRPRAWRALAIAALVAMAPPAPAAASTYPTLRESLDPALRDALRERLLAEFGGTRTQQVPGGKVGIVVADVTDPRHPRVAEANGELMLYAASLPKIAILLGAYVLADRGELVIDDDLRASMTRMIRNSSNRDATAVLNRVGFERLAAILQSDRYRLYDPAHGGGLWVGRDYGGGTVWKRDPINNLSHGASAMQVARFYYLLITGRLVSPEATGEMLEILSNPKIRHKFVKGLEAANPQARIARKSGTWRNFHADSGIVESGDRRYIVVVIGEHPEGGRDLERIMRVVEETFAAPRPGAR